MMLIITFLLMIFTIVGLYGGNVPPAGNTARAMLVYALPFLIVGNVIFLIYWLVLRRFHWMCMPLITILCCIPYIGTLYQFGSLDEKADAKPGIKVATYNVAMTSYRASGGGGTLDKIGVDTDRIDERVVKKYPEIRDMIYEYLKENGSIDPAVIGDPKVIGHWEFVPESVAAPAIARDMRLVFGE